MRQPLSEAFVRYSGKLRSFLQRRYRALDADDLLQDGFVRLLQADAEVPPANPFETTDGCTYGYYRVPRTLTASVKVDF